MFCDERYSNDAYRKQNEMKHKTRRFWRIDNKFLDVILRTYNILIIVHLSTITFNKIIK
jgi:hypothetical protein